MNRVTDIPESLLISFYICGLKLHLQRELLVSRPSTLGGAFALAQITEAHLEGQVAALTGTTTKTVAVMTPQRQSVPRFGGVSEEDDMGVATGDGGDGAGDVHVLIDNGSTHNFIRPDVVDKMCLPIKSTKAFKVYIGSGESLLCESVCSSITLHMKGVVIEVDLYVLPMQGPDVVLGFQWLRNLGKVTHDYAHQTMEFTLLDTTYLLKGDDSLRMKKINLHQMQAMLEHDDVYGVYEIHYLSNETEVEEMSPKTAVPRLAELEQLLFRFDSLFQVPTALLSHRSTDHRIPETKPVNVRPNRYPHYQKWEMEKLVNKMLSKDYRALNVVTVKDKFPIPTANETFDELGGAIIFTKIDLRAEVHE
ncbi:retrotransposon-related protein, partial [Tanacetum coccineum]